MKLLLVLRPEATWDILSARAWFGQFGNTQPFDMALRKTVLWIQDFPEAAPQIRNELRRTKIDKRFPYHVYYLLEQTEL
jgi:hypothetical protein